MIIVSEPKNSVYRNLINLAFDLCDKFILVERKDIDFNGNAKSILEKLEVNLIEVKEQSSWAGNKLGDSTAYVYHYNTDSHAREIISEVSDSLYSWVQPNYPEDLSFYKNGISWLVNNAHEKSGYIITEKKAEIDMIMSIEGLEVEDFDYLPFD